MRRPVAIIVLLIAGLIASCAPAQPVTTLVPLETAVALTLEAIAAAATPLPSQPPPPTLTTAPDALLHPLYFRARDEGGLLQVFRIEKDGRTRQQVTFEPLNVDAYSVSPIDGAVAFITNNQLYLADTAGAGRRLLVDGGPIDAANPWLNSLSSPVWAPDGRSLAYGHDGLSFIDPQTGAISRVLQNQVDTSPGFPLVREIYAPRLYSSDGLKLLIDIGYYEGGTYGIYDPASNALTRLQREDGAIVCCHTYWTPDGSGVYVASPVLGMTESGLFYANADTGQVNILIPGATADGTYNFAYGAQVGPDNKLYFFFNNLPQIPVDSRTPLQLVRSDPDGVSGRTQLLPDTFQDLGDVLWDPGASLVVIVTAAEPSDGSAGPAQVVYTDGRLPVTLAPYARDLEWGP